MKKSTIKQKQQEEEYWRRMQQQRESQPEEMFAYKQHRSGTPSRHVDRICSECGTNWAWYSSDFGKSWQCTEHRKK